MTQNSDWTALWLTLRLALITVIILMILGMPLAWWLARTRYRFKVAIEAIVALPLILPPTVLGFYLLLAMGPQGPVGQAVRALGGPGLPFTFAGLILGSVFYSLPFVVQPLQAAFTTLGRGPLEAAATLRASPLDRFFTVVLPMSRTGVLTAAVLGFAHTIGEFGVVLMIGGNIPGQTQVLSIAIYENVEALNYGRAHLLAGGLLLFSFLLLLTVYILNRRFTIAVV